MPNIGPSAQYGYVEHADARAYADQAGQAVSARQTSTAVPRPPHGKPG
ncbi:hypothetical protein [Streptomyces goshikiensis]